MAYPTDLDNFTDPQTTDTLNIGSHSAIHRANNVAIEALEAKVGADSSAVTTSHDYKLSEVTDKAVGKTATQTLTNKTLTSPKINENVVLTATATELNILDGVTAFRDEDDMASDSATSIASQQSIKAYVDNLFNTLMGSTYPIGRVIIDADNLGNPGTYLGFGTWTAFGAGRVIVGIDAGQTEFDTLGETGGSKTHTLIESEIPVLSHTIGNGGAINRNAGGGSQYGPNSLGTWSQTGGTIANHGGGGAHNNLQPYIVAYMWKRTA